MEKERRGLAPEAYEPIAGERYRPYVDEEKGIIEFTLKAALLGVLFGIVFGAANAYIGLRVGITVSTSIPIAVMTVAIFRLLRPMVGRSTILENNISQTVGSASSSLASGIIFTIPALFLWGFNPSLAKIASLGLLGGILGILFMIPLRKYLISKEHGKLPYPEGTACAEVLVASEAGGAQAKNVFTGLGIGAFYKFLMSILNLWKHKIFIKLPVLKKAFVGFDITPALLGVGYILGHRIAAIMVGGSLVSWVILIPLISTFGEGFTSPLFPEVEFPIKDMPAELIWSRYIRYVGAGAVAFGGIITLIRAIPTMIESFVLSFREIKGKLRVKDFSIRRTERDLPISMVLMGIALIIMIIAIVPHVIGTVESFFIRVIGAIAIVIFSFFFTTVSSRIVGLIGVSSNPTSGMTIATLLGTSLIFVLLGWTDSVGQFAVLTIGTVVCVSASIAGDTSQDLKTGFLVGATPFKQQIGELVGALTSVLFVSLSIIVLDKTYTFGSPELPAPQATLMKLVIEGVLTGNIPWGLVFIGITFAAIMELCSIPSLPFAVGLYLPLSTMTPIFVGGSIRYFIEKKAGADKDVMRERREKGVLFSSGLIAGDGLMGVAIAFYAVKYGIPQGIGYEWMGRFSDILSMLIFGALAYILIKSTRTK